MKESPKTSVDDLLASLSTTYKESINRVAAVTSDEELTAEQSKEQDEAEAQEQPMELTEAAKEKNSKKKVHELMGEDPWPLGRDKLERKNIIQVRADIARRLIEKAKIRECILSDIASMGEDTPVMELGHTYDRPPWQRALRSRKNNLGLTM